MAPGGETGGRGGGASRPSWAGELNRVVTYRNVEGKTLEYPLWQMLVHVANHSTYHRGQVTTMLRRLGAKPIGTDFLRYCDDVQTGPR